MIVKVNHNIYLNFSRYCLDVGDYSSKYFQIGFKALKFSPFAHQVVVKVGELNHFFMLITQLHT